MSFRYRERTVVDGEAIDPHDWSENINALVGELNGKLDRDNFPERVFKTDMVSDYACNRIFQFINVSGTTWNETRNFSIFSGTVDVEEDGVFIVHFGCTWTWTGIVNNPTFTTGNESYFNIRLIVNGTTIATALNFTANQGAYSTYLVGTIPVVGGLNDFECLAIQGADSVLLAGIEFSQRLITIEYKRR